MIQKVNKTEYPELISVWESSVKATHDFLKPEDFIFYKELIPNFFDNVSLHCIKNEQQQIIGFVGTHEENLEMLFVTANQIGKGIGKQLLLYAIEELKISKVDVNEDNLTATAFYKHFGFEIQSTSNLDGCGKPYSILHLELTKEPLN
ncbi:GNAT family N-acetyltransferase [Flavobacterium tistrianum]|uniref:GNAT family N-acetyltransferase n=1 Tax=Flavobacterium tistrianum TaxID=1685414 RepID=UPI000DABF098|nr:GNAT family N-acetyltransferase [Flavobacterium tistrianum]KAF2340854.1 GNAT family N-acetyltransferase [Flavobacterium tistrianum]